MFQLRIWFPFFLLMACMASGASHAQMNKCMVNGVLTYTDGKCPTGAKQQRLEINTGAGSRYAHDVAGFAHKLYDVSVYTSEDAAIKSLVAAEVDLIANRWLAHALAASYNQVPRKAPPRWEDMIQRLRQALAPVVETHLQARAVALKKAGLEGRAPYLREYDALVRAPSTRGDIRFADGSSGNDPGTPQTNDIPEILAFHDTPAAVKWRKLWPDLRAYGSQLLALHYRISADPELNRMAGWEARAQLLASRVGGRMLTQKESNDRLGFTLQGLGRFLLPLGTDMSRDDRRAAATTIESRGQSVVITPHEGGSIAFRIVDSRWDADISKRLSPKELQQIEDALTASFVKNKGRWFAPLELDFDAYMNVSKRLRNSREMQEVFRSFAEQSTRAMENVWAGWK